MLRSKGYGEHPSRTGDRAEVDNLMKKAGEGSELARNVTVGHGANLPPVEVGAADAL